MTPRELALAGIYDYRLVAVSVVIAIIGSYAALELAGRVTASSGLMRLAWLIGGSATMGIGIWSMHYTAMLAFSLPIPVAYDLPTVLVSLLLGVLSSALALFVVSRQKMGARRAVAAGIFMGGGIAALHYTSMAAMRLAAMCHYSPALVILSIVLAVAFSLVSLWRAFLFREERPGRVSRKAASALLMGAAITAMHYTAMAAASFTPSEAAPDLSHAVNISRLGTAGIDLAALTVLGITILTCLVDRFLEQKALLNELFEQAPQAVALMSGDDRIIRVNREFTRLFGYTPQVALGRRLSDLVVPSEFREEAQRSAELMAPEQRVDAQGIRQRQDGSRLYVSIIRVPVSMPSGQIAVYAIYRDITGRRRAEEEVQKSHGELRALAARLQNAREEERTRVAREIHDELGQALTAIKIDLTTLVRELPADNTPAVQRSQSIVKLLDQAIQSIQRIVTDLRPGVLDDLGLAAALEWAAEEFQSRTGTRCRVSVPDADIAIDSQRVTALFRIFQETLTNTARHAHATEVTIELAKENGDLSLEIHDNGQGMGEERLLPGRSLGILGMRERALLLGGEITIQSAPGKGTTVRVRIPSSERNPPEADK